jgi:hypothetical protein
MNFLDRAETQFIDSSGKLRAVNLDSGITIMTSPLPPLAIPISDKIYDTTLDTAISFVKKYDMQIDYQDGNQEDGIQGLWLEPTTTNILNLVYCYIPIEITEAMKDVDFAPINYSDPIRTPQSSQLQKLRHNRKVAQILQQYTLFLYSYSHPEELTEDNFIIDGDYKYSLKDKRLNIDNPIFRDGLLIVPNETVRDRLLYYLKVQILNNLDYILTFRGKNTIDGYYQDIVDFRKNDDQNIFISKDAIKKYAQSIALRRPNIVCKKFMSTNREPYYYNIEEEGIHLIQNTKDLLVAITVGDKWRRDTINLGYDANIAENVYEIPYEVYPAANISDMSDDNDKIKVLQYYDGNFAAILKI